MKANTNKDFGKFMSASKVAKKVGDLILQKAIERNNSNFKTPLMLYVPELVQKAMSEIYDDPAVVHDIVKRFCTGFRSTSIVTELAKVLDNLSETLWEDPDCDIELSLSSDAACMRAVLGEYRYDNLRIDTVTLHHLPMQRTDATFYVLRG